MEKTFELWDKERRKVVKVEGKKQGNEWVALCPEHDDHNPSLRINEEKRVYYCDVCGWGGAFYDSNYKRNSQNYKKEKEIVAIYNYKDELGKLLYQVVRFYPKDFRQRRPDNNGGWIWNLRKERRVLYRLPELIKAPDPVFIVEGEKDVDNLWKWDLAATASPMGVKKWRPEYNKALEGREIVLIPDNDEEGREHMEQIGEVLFKKAKQIKWLELPGVEEKEDVSDWIQREGTKEEFLKLAKHAPEYNPTGKGKTKSEGQTKNIPTKTLIPNLIHLVREDSTIKYLLKKENKLYIQDNFTLDGITYRSKQDLPIKIPTPEILEEPMDINCGELFDEIIEFIKTYLEMPSETDYLILTLWIFHTYLIGKFNTTPILYFYGVKETGKTRAGEVLSELAFWCERLTSPTEATLFRSANYFKTSLIIDEIKLWGQDGNPEVARLIKSRYKRGLMVSRVNLNKRGEEQIEYFDVFAPLVLCTTESIPDTIESRCITFLMQKNSKAEVEKLIDEQWANKLRNKLTVFRTNYLNQDLLEVEQIARRRLNEIMLPLYQILMLVAPERKEEFKMIVEEMERTKEDEEGLSLEAEIVQEIINYQKETEEKTFLTIEIAERLNKERSDKEKITNMLVSVRIKRLGFEKVRLTNGKRGFKINSELLAKLAFQFGLSL